MKIEYGKGTTEYGPGVMITLTSVEIAKAIDVWLYSQGVIARGARTIRCGKIGTVYVDPSGFLIYDGKKWSGRGEEE